MPASLLQALAILMLTFQAGQSSSIEPVCLLQAADRFMHMLEQHNGPDHLVVFITSDQDLQKRSRSCKEETSKWQSYTMDLLQASNQPALCMQLMSPMSGLTSCSRS